MNKYALPQIYGQIEYLETSLNLIKEEVAVLTKKTSPPKTLFGSLPKTNLTLADFKKLRQKLSSSWEKKWST